jgi:thiosulfate dehydrogenase [quinone] large subunit
MDSQTATPSPLAGTPAEEPPADAARTGTGTGASPGTPVPLFHSRRDFCVTACQALALGALAATIQACGGGSNGNPNDPGGGSVPLLPTLNATVVNGAATLTIAGTSLASTNGAALVSTPNLGQLLVVRTGDTSFSVLTATCTHEACTITGFDNGVFQCPCHGSRYSTSGSVIRGPATRSLRTFNASIANGVVSISA